MPPELLQAVALHADVQTRLTLLATSHATRKAVNATPAAAHSHAIAALQRPPLALCIAESERLVGALTRNAALQGSAFAGDLFSVCVDSHNAALFAHLQRTNLKSVQFVKAPSRHDRLYAKQALAMMALCAAGLAVVALATGGRPALAHGAQAAFGCLLVARPLASAFDGAPAAAISPPRFLSCRAGLGYAASAAVLLVLDTSIRPVTDTRITAPTGRVETLSNLPALVHHALLLRQTLNCCLGLAMAALSFTSMGTRPIQSTSNAQDFRDICDAALLKISQKYFLTTPSIS